ncbi:hypothetical protein GE21DRAFT_9266 [Neurospora crassa]|uniref:Uncharacterized protein n=1 Tax=Neurospora crassa (strain ATCC 24698 / 74-OR23-1A / CBS 708.71 / DSM 1257 / FGSC 987) TaxID=367110 RepID=Q7RZG4_NEUCR|nr:hypothetical protein NCU04052 [Neurospora crassa OR74A]EAA28431.2 hypothetical protein NCU04052 [Neurospora crassa OR74A]KHE81852.1 hypothetical protein GE21DRAFT_9266 [Neurospora crassa]|eukprot:XP_957667.2 hypothetical protein NCU04052 [Neurospora crassa OR74A]
MSGQVKKCSTLESVAISGLPFGAFSISILPSFSSFSPVFARTRRVLPGYVETGMRANRANPNGFPDPAPNFHLSLLLSSFVQQGPDPVDSLASGPTYRRGAMDFSTEAGPSGRPAVTVQGPLKGGSACRTPVPEV